MSEIEESGLVNLDGLREAMEDLVPFNRLLGFKAEELSRGFVRARCPFKPELIGDARRPALHGGVLATFADATCGAAVFTKLRKGDTCATVDLRIDYLRPGLEQDTICEAEVLRVGNQVAVTSARLFQDSGADIAVCKAVFMVKRARES